VEELTRGAVEAEGASEPLGLPGLLRDSLTARLDRLGRAKEVAQLAGVIGRSFSFELLAAVSPLDRAALLKELDRLVRAELLVRRGMGERGSFGFKHALLQEAACELLLPGDLERLHGRVAEALETRFPEIAAGQPELVAFHYTGAGQPEKAIEHWLQAGQKALQRFATQEALEHFRNGLRLVEALPEGPRRDHLELSLRISSAPAVVAARGHCADEAEALFDRALALGRQLGDMPNPFQSLLWSFYTWRGDLEKAKAVATQMLLSSKARRDVEGQILGLQELATIQAHLGRPRSALRALKRALELYPAETPSGSTRALLFSGWDAKCHNLCEAARTLADAGYPDRALRYGRRGLRLAESLADPYSTAMAFQYLSFIHHLRREYPEASRHARWMHDLSLNQGFTFFAAHGRFLLSLTRARLAVSENPECPEDAVVLVGEAIQALDVLHRDHRQELDLPDLLGWLAEVCVHCGMTSEARWLLEEAFEISARTGERLGLAELYRLQGLLFLAEEASLSRSQAEESFLRALAEARSAESRWLELRAAIDLARLWRQEGRGEPARDLLTAVVESFTEGWETADLREARELLEGMGGAE
jgi:tetratricopeptide (TPR) repeat protein